MMKEESENSYLFGDNAPYIEGLYEAYLRDPTSVSDYWHGVFRSVNQAERGQPRLEVEAAFRERSKHPQRNLSPAPDMTTMQKQVSVLRLIYSYRILGVHHADLDPLARTNHPITEEPSLNPQTYGLTTEDLAHKFYASAKFANDALLSLSDIIAHLKKTYCGKIGIEYMHIINPTERHWVRDYFEGTLSTPRFKVEEKRRILKKLTWAETFERYFNTKFVGQKRFSLEGGESLIPGLDYVINQAPRFGVQSIVIGMAHRGRLNVLVNILGKSPQDLIDEFTGKTKITLPSGDVKYHNGFTADIETQYEPVHISLEFNPSHLEIVNPVVEGNVRARQDRRKRAGEPAIQQVLPILIHGDAAFAGLGVNQSTFNLSQVRGFTTGGTVHVVINNQIGFTTSNPQDTRSTTFCTDIAKMVDAPIFHVNGDDPEAVAYVMNIALEFRMRFNKDAVVDLVCYRRLGHNEGDEPSLTQPMMYQAIRKHSSTLTLYRDHLIKTGFVQEEEAEAMIKDYHALMDAGKHVQQSNLGSYKYKYSQDWDKFKDTPWDDPVDTSLSLKEIQSLSERFTTVPENFKLHRVVDKLVEQRKQMGVGKIPIDWGMAEILAYASLVTQGAPVRITGEDSGRGTFAHRHAVFHDQNPPGSNQKEYITLQHLSKDQAPFAIYDSVLNEEAVLAYEYGYACASPTSLTIWEAQFGDFSNGAQTAIDQFITSGETKWGRLCGLTIILPHGQDGAGPEHSSGRLERWLQLCAEDNIQIVYPSEAAQMFHVLRRQVLRPYRKPLIIFLSKRLLRFKPSLNLIEDFTEGSGFKTMYPESQQQATHKIKRVILCAGQVYYDLVNEREKRNLQDKIAILRIEQLYPFPQKEFLKLLTPYAKVKDIKWVQEEPLNQGAWTEILHQLLNNLDMSKQTLTVAARPASASPAVGYKALFDKQLADLLDEAMSL